ncbi:MAG: cytochrome oxidase putative small subunit CydP [Lysobacteraceae bacterium]
MIYNARAGTRMNSPESLPLSSTPPPRPGMPSWIARLRRHLTWALLAKLALLTLLYFLCFAPSQRPHMDAGAVADRLFPTR